MLVMALKSGACDLTLEEASALRHQCNQFLFFTSPYDQSAVWTDPLREFVINVVVAPILFFEEMACAWIM